MECRTQWTLYSSSVLIFYCFYLYIMYKERNVLLIYLTNLFYRYNNKRAYKCRNTRTNGFFIIKIIMFETILICIKNCWKEIPIFWTNIPIFVKMSDKFVFLVTGGEMAQNFATNFFFIEAFPYSFRKSSRKKAVILT